MKTMLTVSKNWHKPLISSIITDDTLSLSMNIEDFKRVLLDEIGKEIKKELIERIGSITFMFTKETFTQKLTEAYDNSIESIMGNAFDRILYGIKEESKKVVV